MSRPTQDPCTACCHFAYGILTLCDRPSHAVRLWQQCPTSKSYNPKIILGLGFSRFARRYSGNRVFFLFLQVLRCFSSLGLSPDGLCIQPTVPAYDHWWVSPFGHPRIKAYFRLPEAFRWLSRPSSTPSAKASSVRPCLLNLLSYSPASDRKLSNCLLLFLPVAWQRRRMITRRYPVFKDRFAHGFR